ncbi:LacI family DNA-binding transcriptional regulator [Pengzhenrongella sicca]|uniref:LacI family DNA-binding transcriptional regulator n=1 Tax=Pengzhenrongella sicca TaxID=2819238 RepID=A0A8A4ZGV1_9MICO|nr:LacI family DNA-binding transcriptional regulator [Pengzhenrongella sicca]QTE30183.1 LacI family DNA-binding transcriptional regulator [Pengzhenrongella sicca]
MRPPPDPTPPRPRQPTITDVARLAGTSKATVSFVVNGRTNVADATRERVLAAAETLGWTPSRRARSLSTSQAYALGLVFARGPETLGSDPFFAPFIGGFESALAELDRSLLLRFVDGPELEEAAYRRLHDQGRVDGVVLTDVRHDDPRIDLLTQLGLPAVTLNRLDGPSPFPAVVLDDLAGTAAAVEYLVGLGHEHIAYVGGPELYLHTTRRRLAWQEALESHGLPAGVFVETDFSAAGGALATTTVLGLTVATRPTAILYGNDSMAIAGIVAAQQAGLHVPRDLSVIGFEDSELSAHVSPPLTTIHSDSFTWGRTAAEALLELLRTGDSSAEHTLPPARLVIRGSAAARADPGR